MAETPSFESVSTKQQRIAELAKQNPTMAFTSLNHYLDAAWLREAFGSVGPFWGVLLPSLLVVGLLQRDEPLPASAK